MDSSYLWLARILCDVSTRGMPDDW